jgi:glucose/arabinose dehydrogenase
MSGSRSSSWRRARALVLLPLLVGLASCVVPPSTPPGFRQEVVAGGLDLPTTWVQAPDAAVQYVGQKAGVIRVVRNGQVLATPLVDLRGRVNDGGDRGLMGMALHPSFASNGYLYLAYTYQDPTLAESDWRQTQRVTRITVRGDVADPASEVVVLGRVTGAACYDAPRTADCIPAARPVHTIDDLAFDGAGALWVSIGDGAAPGYSRAEADRAQDLAVLAGKLLRVDATTGRGLPGNPFFDPQAPDANAGRVWAYGLRNPFRFTFHPTTGIPYVADVGADRFEEINVVRAGGNYGWPCYEGHNPVPENAERTVCRTLRDAGAPVLAPAVAYGRDQGISITGGVFYTGRTYPADYAGTYVYGDYGGYLRRQAFTDGRPTGGAVSFVDKAVAGAPVQIRMGPDGNIWYLSIYPGELRRVVYTGVEEVPSSCPDGQYRAEYFNNTQLSGPPAVVRCQGAIDHDWGSGAPTPGVAVDHFSVRWTGRIPMPGGTHRFSATTEDGLRLRINGTLHVDRWVDGPLATSTRDVRLNDGHHTVVMETYHRTGAARARLASARLGTAPRVTVTSPADLTRVAPGAPVSYTASATDAEDGTLPAGSITVDVIFHHYTDATTFHQHPYHTSTGTTGSFVADGGHGPGLYQIVARATDSSGWTSTSAPVHVCLRDNRFGPCA